MISEQATNNHTALSIGPDRTKEGVSTPPFVLLKKKRAISYKEMIALLCRQASFVSNLEPIVEAAANATPVSLVEDDSNCPDGFRYYHSGISPPSA